MLDFPIREGFWTDHAIQATDSRVLTLSTQRATLLITFLALFASMVGARLWIIIVYSIHQIQATQRFKTVFPHQVQAIIRNTFESWQTAIELFWLTWGWRKDAGRAVSRSILLILLAIATGVGIFLFGIFLPSITLFSKNAAQSYGLVKEGSCGFIAFDPYRPSDRFGAVQWQLGKYVDAQTYADNCYARHEDSYICNVLPVRRVPYKTESNATCASRYKFCKGYSPTSFFKLDTGKISSLKTLGINTPKEDEVFYRRVVNCSPFALHDDFTEWLNGTQMHAKYGGHYPPHSSYFVVKMGWVGSDFTYSSRPYSYLYDASTTPKVGVGYNVEALSNTRQWYSLRQLFRKEGDQIMIFLSPDSVKYTSKVRGPVFSAQTWHNLSDYTMPLFYPEHLVSAIACVDRFSYCTSDKCTPLSTSMDEAWAEVLHLTSGQKTTVNRIRYSEYDNGFDSAARNLGANSLLANRQLVIPEMISPGLPDDQLKLEIQHWFNITLARLQIAVAEVSAQPPTPYGTVQNSTIVGLKKQCGKQKIKTRGLYQSFRVLALGTFLAIGSLVILISLCIEKIGGAVQRLFRVNPERKKQYLSDHFLQLQLQSFEDAGARDWKFMTRRIPVPVSKFLISKRTRDGAELSRYQVWPASKFEEGNSVRPPEKAALVSHSPRNEKNI